MEIKFKITRAVAQNLSDANFFKNFFVPCFTREITLHNNKEYKNNIIWPPAGTKEREQLNTLLNVATIISGLIHNYYIDNPVRHNPFEECENPYYITINDDILLLDRPTRIKKLNQIVKDYIISANVE